MAKYTVTNEKKDNKKEALLERIRDDFKVAREYWSEQKSLAKEDYEFRADKQWSQDDINSRKIDGRPCLVVNKVKPLVKQIVNSQKKNRPSINVNPQDADAKREVAKVIQAIVKNIETQSNANSIYDSAFDAAVTCGEGYFRIITDHTSKDSFDQEVFLKPIDNIHSVYIDPSITSNYEEYNYAFVFKDITKKEYERLYPDSECSKNTMFGDNEWIREDQVRVAEYFYIEYKTEKHFLTENGLKMSETDYKNLDEKNRKNLVIKKTRNKTIKTVKWVKTNGLEILEETDFPGTRIPVIPVFGEFYVVDGKTVLEGIIRSAKDVQRTINLNYSNSQESLQLAPKAPFIGAAGQFEGKEHEWNNANRKSYGFLEYNPVSLNGQPVPPPQRTPYDIQMTGLTNAQMAASEDLKAVTGIYDYSLGSDKIESSGTAIMNRQRQGEVTNFVYVDNLSKALQYAGNILLEIIPVVYDTERVIRIKGNSNDPDQLMVLNGFNEKESVFLESGKYDCEISIGPYGENQRQEAINNMQAMFAVKPELFDIAGDIFVGKMDWEGAKEVSKRMEVLLPPELRKNQELPEEVRVKLAQQEAEFTQKIQEQEMIMAQMQQVISTLTAEANEARNEANNKQADIQSKERIANIKATTDLIKAGLKEQSLDARMVFKEELESTRERSQGIANVPEQEDTLVLSGVNDPISQQKQGVEDDMSEEELDNLYAKLSQFQQGQTTTKVKTNG